MKHSKPHDDSDITLVLPATGTLEGKRDPEDMNAIRALCAAAALVQFQRETGADDSDALSDLLCDLMHWCDRSGEIFSAELRRGAMHYEAETTTG